MNNKNTKTCTYCGHETARFVVDDPEAASCPACGLPMDPPPDEWFNDVARRVNAAEQASRGTVRILVAEVARLREDESREVADVLEALRAEAEARANAEAALEEAVGKYNTIMAYVNDVREGEHALCVIDCPDHGLTFDLWTSDGDDMPDTAPCGKCGRESPYDTIHTLRDALYFVTGVFTVIGTGGSAYGVLNYPMTPTVDTSRPVTFDEPKAGPIKWDLNDNGAIDNDEEAGLFGIAKASVVLAEEAVDTVLSNGLDQDECEFKQYLAEYLAEVMTETHAMAYEQGMEAASKWTKDVAGVEDVQSD